MDWDELWKILQIDLHRLGQEVRAQVSSVEISVTRGPSTQIQPFLANLEFGFPARYAATPWGVDVIVQLACGQVGHMGLRDPEGHPFLPHQSIGRYAFICEVERGNGELITGLAPTVMPPDTGSPEFREAAERFVGASVGFLSEQAPVIVDTLSQPGESQSNL